MYLLPVLSLLPALLPLATALPPPNNLTWEPLPCMRQPLLTFHAYDCTILLDSLRFYPFYTRALTYGPTEPAPGNTPSTIMQNTCRFFINQAEHSLPFVADTFVLADYEAELRAVAAVCLSKGYSGGAVSLGPRKDFVAYLGGVASR